MQTSAEGASAGFDALPGEPARGLVGRLARSGIVGYLAILVQLGLLAVIIRQFQIESSAFLRLALLAFGGFAVHYFLPASVKLPFFVLLSLSGILLVMGPSTGLVLIALGLVLIGACHLPIRFSLRVGILLALGTSFAALRTGAVASPWSSAVWPILGAMFMFRLIVYMYDLQHEKGPSSVWRTLGYFFVLPNVCFPLFPVIDFKTFRRTYYDQPANAIHQVGVNWMIRGITHLILYRVIYYYLAIGTSDIVTARDLAQYLVTNFLLYLRVSGQFHLVIGMLHLFGFRLPETNHLYCLSSSFTEFWRRINIYWKDFMIKVFYYPAYFRLRKLGETKALVLATLFVFVVTWLLHSYQWFWLRDSFPIKPQDAAFWGILALLVVVTSLYEMKRKRKRTAGASRWSFRALTIMGVKTVGTFAAIITLWSLWTADSFGGWASMWSVSIGPTDVVVLAGCIALFGIGGALILAWTASPLPATEGHRAVRTGLMSATTLGCLALAGLPQVYEHLTPEASSVVVSLKSGKLSRRDMAALERGYYEDLLQVNRLDNQLWEVYMNKPLGWLDIQSTGLVRFTGDFLQRELAPSRVATDSFSTVSTNRWGMRDQEYDKAPDSGTYRMSLLGASTEMGWGVEDNETYESLVEARLNRDLAGKGYKKYEILNHAVPGYYPLQQAMVVEKALTFRPHTVLYMASGRELSRSAAYLAEAVNKKIELPYPGLRAVATEAGLESGMPEDEAVRRLKPYREKLLSWLYEHIVTACRAQGVIPVWVFVPQIYEGTWVEETRPALNLAREHGFLTIDLSDAYEGVDTSSLKLAEWDEHPNARGHAILAERLYRALVENAEPLELFGKQKTDPRQGH
jgi:alginate O-acetyltransferase complex protein AlgI